MARRALAGGSWVGLIVPILFGSGFYVGNVYQMYGVIYDVDLQRLFHLIGLVNSLFSGAVQGADILLIRGVMPIEVGVVIGLPSASGWRSDWAWMGDEMGLSSPLLILSGRIEAPGSKSSGYALHTWAGALPWGRLSGHCRK